MSKALKNNNNLILVSTILIILIASFSSNIKDLTGRATQEIVDDTQDGYDINGNLFNPY